MGDEVTPEEEILQMITLGIAATERGEYDAGMQLLGHAYRVIKPAQYPKGLSSYGLCLAKAAGKNRAGAELCEEALKLQFYEGRHWANLVRVYIAAKNRRKAVEALESGLKRTRNDPALLNVREEIGYRKAPYLRFLGRTNPLNRLYSRFSGRLKRRGMTIALVVAALLYVGAMVAVFFTILE
jgi:tetratricopeptide (TPR) repeat protein